MEFGIAKLPMTFQKHTNRSLNAKQQKNNNKELSSIEERKVNTNLSYDGKVCHLGKLSLQKYKLILSASPQLQISVSVIIL